MIKRYKVIEGSESQKLLTEYIAKKLQIRQEVEDFIRKYLPNIDLKNVDMMVNDFTNTFSVYALYINPHGAKPDGWARYENTYCIRPSKFNTKMYDEWCKIPRITQKDINELTEKLGIHLEMTSNFGYKSNSKNEVVEIIVSTNDVNNSDFILEA
ncbi:hypothetical protein M2325_000726 [Methanococcus voltae PS]|uniref:Uncharacterized protein n=1 Tax=Methanococcus voltae PS TaxID=523842 RepID=A0ABT2EVQ5_METVO|nr:hypothetical protein [Methanococcus voltae]MCS3922041.1 hypothetical protein [Methanococcus voltae PS]